MKTKNRGMAARWKPRTVATAMAVALCVVGLGPLNTVTAQANVATDALATIEIAHANDIRGNVFLPATVTTSDGTAVITWTSSNPSIVSDKDSGGFAAGVVNRPAPGSSPASVKMTACATLNTFTDCRDIVLTIHPANPPRAEYTGYAQVNFTGTWAPGDTITQNRESVYAAVSVGNDVLKYEAINDRKPFARSNTGDLGLRDPVIVRSPEGDRFFMIATDLCTSCPNFTPRGGWGWAQTGGASNIMVWESADLATWTDMRSVTVNTSKETGMTFAPEAIWDPTQGVYVVYWSSAIYPEGSYYSLDTSDPNARPGSGDAFNSKLPGYGSVSNVYQKYWGRNVTYYTTTRDFINFAPSKVMYDRCGPNTTQTFTYDAFGYPTSHTGASPSWAVGGTETPACDWNHGYGNLDPMIVYNPDDGYYYKAVQDRWDKVYTYLYPECFTAAQQYTSLTDLYLERSKSILAPANQWELMGGCLTRYGVQNGIAAGTVPSTTSMPYKEGPNLLHANPGDVNGNYWYMFSDGGGLSAYRTADLSTGSFTAVTWTAAYRETLRYTASNPAGTASNARGSSHGHTFALTAAEHAQFRGATLDDFFIVTAPTKLEYKYGEALDLTDLKVDAAYTEKTQRDALAGIEIKEGFGGYIASGYDPTVPGIQTVTLSFTVGDVTKTDTFQVNVTTDKSVLQTAYDTVQALSNDDNKYSTGSWGALQQAIADAKQILDDPAATQPQIDAAVVAISSALAGLSAPADKSVLQAIYDLAMAISNTNNKYSQDSWDALQLAIADAKQVLDNPDSTQSHIDAAVVALSAAIAGLTAPIVVPTKPPVEVLTGGTVPGAQSGSAPTLAMLMVSTGPRALRTVKRHL